MKKLVLNLEALEVESFETRGGMRTCGTVDARINAVEVVADTQQQFCTALCHTVNYLPCDTDLCKSNQYTCAHSCTAIICINF